MQYTILFATGNAHKIQEVEQILGKTPIVWQSLKQVGWNDDIIEDGNTFRENALIKARTLYEAGYNQVVSEDSGIEVDGLGKAPGIYSARYAGEGKNDTDNLQLLLNNLRDNPLRSARYRAVLCWIDDGAVRFYEGSWEGQIRLKPSGSGGFGYDPIFVPEGYSQTVAELPDTVKQNESHRAKAFIQFKTDWLKKYPQ